MAKRAGTLHSLAIVIEQCSDSELFFTRVFVECILMSLCARRGESTLRTPPRLLQDLNPALLAPDEPRGDAEKFVRDVVLCGRSRPRTVKRAAYPC